MATVTVPPPLQEQLGDAAAESLVGMFKQLEASRNQERETHKEQLFELLEERFLRHVAESEGRLRTEIAEVRAGTAESASQLRAEIAEVREEIAEVRAGTAESAGQLRAEIAESASKLRAEMQAGFDRQQQQLTRQQEQMADLGKEIGLVRSDLTAQIGDLRGDMHQQIGDLRGDVHQQIGDVHKQIGDVHKQIARQTRWLLTALAGAVVLYPIIQRLVAALLP